MTRQEFPVLRGLGSQHPFDPDWQGRVAADPGVGIGGFGQDFGVRKNRVPDGMLRARAVFTLLIDGRRTVVRPGIQGDGR